MMLEQDMPKVLECQKCGDRRWRVEIEWAISTTGNEKMTVIWLVCASCSERTRFEEIIDGIKNAKEEMFVDAGAA